MCLNDSLIPPSSRRNILCVDDDYLGLYLRRCILEKHGYVVTAVSDPLIAVDLDLSAIALAIFDFNMPELNGLELLRRMQQQRGITFPVILLSGNVDQLPAAVRSSFCAYFDKGRSSRFLLAAISSLLESKASGLDQPRQRQTLSAAHSVAG